MENQQQITTNPTKTMKTTTIEKVNELFSKYKEDEYMLNKLYNYINFNLPNVLENEYTTKTKREERTIFLTQEQQQFSQLFLSKNKYYYLSNTNSFYIYDNKNYQIIKEDDIQHNLLTQISSPSNVLKDWKYKTKNLIVRQIKEKHNLFKSVPESITIQHVLKFLSPTFLKTKQHAKYFLTIIGDNILKKSQQLNILVPKNARPFIEYIHKFSSKYLNISHSTSSFVYKYNQSYEYENCRLLSFNETLDFDYWLFMFQRISLNLFCVATHYSNRFGNSENYIDNKCDETLKTYSLFLKTNTIETIVDSFIQETIEKTIETGTGADIYTVSGKDILFIWKHYLTNHKYLNISYIKTIKGILQDKLEYNEEKDEYYNITSSLLPTIGNFLKFWNENIVYNKIVQMQDEHDNCYGKHFEDEMEIDEICIIYKQKYGFVILEQDVVKIVKHYFQEFVQIIDDKYIKDITSIKNYKQTDIYVFLQIYRTKLKNERGKIMQQKQPYDENDVVVEEIVQGCELIHIEDIYIFYAKYYQTLHKYVVNKNYFIRYVRFVFEKHIVYDNFLSGEWLLS